MYVARLRWPLPFAPLPPHEAESQSPHLAITALELPAPSVRRRGNHWRRTLMKSTMVVDERTPSPASRQGLRFRMCIRSISYVTLTQAPASTVPMLNFVICLSFRAGRAPRSR